MIKPNRHAEWALLSNTGTVEGLPNKAIPTLSYKNYGQGEYELLPRQYINDVLYVNDYWNKYFEYAIDNLGTMNVIESGAISISSGDSNKYYKMTSGSSITLENIVTTGGGDDQIGATVKVKTISSTTVSKDAGVTLVGFTGTIPANSTATFTIQALPSGTGTEWSCALSSGA